MKTYKIIQKAEIYGNKIYQGWRIAEKTQGKMGVHWRGGNFNSEREAREWAKQNDITLEN